MRIARAVASAVALVLLLLGVPVALLAYGHWPSWSELADLPTSPLDDTTAFAVLTVVAWVAWAAFAATAVAEIAAELWGAQRWSIPFGSPFQAPVRRLVTALTMGATLSGPLAQRAAVVPLVPALTEVASAQVADAPGPAVETDLSRSTPDVSIERRPTAPAFEPAQAPVPLAESALPTVTVQPGDTPWGLAVQHLGDGIRWREIWDLNRGAPQPDGRAWVTEDLIHPGWQLRLPVATADATALPTPVPPACQPDDAEGRAVDSGPALPSPSGPESGPTNPSQPDDPGSTPAPDATGEGEPPSGDPGQEAVDGDMPADDPASDSDPGAGDDSEAPDGGWPSLLPQAGVTGATVLATGLALHLRRLQRRRRMRGHVPESASEQPARQVEQNVVMAADLPLVRWAAQQLGELATRLRPRSVNGGPVAVELSEQDGIELLWDTPNPRAPAPWTVVGPGWSWRLAYDPEAPTPDDEHPTPLPALVTVGKRDGRQLLVDLEAFGTICVTGDQQRVEDLVRSVVLELSADEELADAYVSLVDVDLDIVPQLDRVTATTAEQAVDHLRSTVASVEDALAASKITSTFEFQLGDETHIESAVAVARPDDPDLVEAIIDACPPRRGVAAVLIGEAPGAGAQLTIDADGTGRLDPLGVTIDVAGVPATTAEELTALFTAEAAPVAPHEQEAAAGPAHDAAGTGVGRSADGMGHDIRLPTANGHSGRRTNGAAPRSEGGDDHHEDAALSEPEVGASDRYVAAQNDPVGANVIGTHVADGGHARTSNEATSERDENGEARGHAAPASGDRAPDGAVDADDSWAIPVPRLLVRVLGPPRIPDRPRLGRREQILTVLLACRGAPVKNSTVQNLIWNGQQIEPKTLWNLIGATRTALGHFDDGTPVMPPADRLTNTVRVVDGVTTDLAVLRVLYDRAQTVSSTEAIDLLRRGLDLVEGPPFDAPGYDWAHHAEQLVADASALIEQATEHLVELALGADMVDVAREAIVRGLRGLPGNEVLYRARMLLEHGAGNPAGVKAAYGELLLHLDDFDTEPSPVTLALYNQLTGHALR